MKKTLSFLIAVSLCLSILLTATSCIFKHPIEKFEDKMEKADSYEMTITMSNVPFLGTVTMTTQVDGDISYTPATVLAPEEYYLEEDGDVTYKYSKNLLGKWEKEEYKSEDDTDLSEEEFEELFNAKNFEKVKGEKNVYKQKDDVEFEQFKDVEITIEDDSCTIEMSITSEGMTFDMEIVISKIGEIELTLPEVG